MKAKKINLETIQVEWIDGSIKKLDFAKPLAEGIFKTTADLKEHVFAVDLFKNPEVELTEENKEIIRANTAKLFLAYVQVAVNDLLEEK